MRFFSVLVSAALAACAFAQDTPIGFTDVPTNVTAGNTYKISWSGGDGSPVTITLREGESPEIQTIQVLTTSATGTSFEWQSNKTLIDGEDYSLQITQGLDTINYSGLFTISGGVNAISASISSILATASVSTSGVSTSSAANSTITSLAAGTSVMANATGSMGTGTAMSRNTTFSSATQTGASKTGSLASSTGTATGSAIGTATDSGSATGTGSSASATSSTSQSGLSIRHASPMVVLCGILAVVAYAV